ncbi:MAG: hypothetical protein ACLP9L_39290, partial [Thermoguttaceae bacterium]
MSKLIVVSLVLAMASTLASRAMADYISNIQANDASGNVVTVNNVPLNEFGQGNGQDPVVSAILSQPSTVGGHTYTNWSFLINDGTGGMDIFGKLPTSSTYMPT